MGINALAVANYFIELAKEDKTELRLLGLVKRVYIAHGFSLALYGRPLLDPRFDKVEAWKYGPVIPSVYHSFKHNESNPITKGAVIARWDDEAQEEHFETPKLTESQDKELVKAIWSRYKGRKDWEMVELTHVEGSPWAEYYIEGRNIEIPDTFTKAYYEEVMKLIRSGQI